MNNGILFTTGTVSSQARVDAAREAERAASQRFDQTDMGSPDFYSAFRDWNRAQQELSDAERDLAYNAQTSTLEKILNASSRVGFGVELLSFANDLLSRSGFKLAPSTIQAQSLLRAAEAAAVGNLAINDFSRTIDAFNRTNPFVNPPPPYVPNRPRGNSSYNGATHAPLPPQPAPILRPLSPKAGRVQIMNPPSTNVTVTVTQPAPIYPGRKSPVYITSSSEEEDASNHICDPATSAGVPAASAGSWLEDRCGDYSSNQDSGYPTVIPDEQYPSGQVFYPDSSNIDEESAPPIDFQDTSQPVNSVDDPTNNYGSNSTDQYSFPDNMSGGYMPDLNLNDGLSSAYSCADGGMAGVASSDYPNQDANIDLSFNPAPSLNMEIFNPSDNSNSFMQSDPPYDVESGNSIVSQPIDNSMDMGSSLFSAADDNNFG